MSARPSRSFACAFTALSLATLCAPARADSDGDRERDRSKDRTVNVDCAAGDTIARALTKGDERKSLTILISGTCSESIVINRSDVKLAAAAPGATVSGPDPLVDTIRVTGSRVTIDGITVTGGRNGITGDGAAGLIVQNAFVQGTGRNGITYAHGASGIVDTVMVSGNTRDGIAIDAASATIIRSQITQNARQGINMVDNSAARIGIDNANNPAGNSINDNGGFGININFGSGTIIAMNEIKRNGTNPAQGRAGINLTSASADIIGGNTISDNAGTGISMRGGSVQIGDTGFGFTSANSITGNGNPAQPGGIFGFLGSSLNILNATISGNNGFGIVLSLRSEAQIASSTIQNNVPAGTNTGDGIRLVFGSGLFVTTPIGTISGNSGFGLNCTDGESSVINTSLLGIGLNGSGGVAPSCTGF